MKKKPYFVFFSIANGKCIRKVTIYVSLNLVFFSLGLYTDESLYSDRL